MVTKCNLDDTCAFYTVSLIENTELFDYLFKKMIQNFCWIFFTRFADLHTENSSIFVSVCCFICKDNGTKHVVLSFVAFIVPYAINWVKGFNSLNQVYKAVVGVQTVKLVETAVIIDFFVADMCTITAQM